MASPDWKVPDWKSLGWADPKTEHSPKIAVSVMVAAFTFAMAFHSKGM